MALSRYPFKGPVLLWCCDGSKHDLLRWLHTWLNCCSCSGERMLLTRSVFCTCCVRFRRMHGLRQSRAHHQKQNHFTFQATSRMCMKTYRPRHAAVWRFPTLWYFVLRLVYVFIESQRLIIKWDIHFMILRFPFCICFHIVPETNHKVEYVFRKVIFRIC